MSLPMRHKVDARNIWVECIGLQQLIFPPTIAPTMNDIFPTKFVFWYLYQIEEEVGQ
jgi:hypothetical protein